MNIFILATIGNIILLYSILMIVRTKSIFLTQIFGDIFLTIGISFLSGAVIASDVITDTLNFLTFLFAGLYFLVFGILLRAISKMIEHKISLSETKLKKALTKFP